MEEQSLKHDQSSDEPESGFYLSMDLLDELMGALATAYGKLLLFEKCKLFPDEGLVKRYAELQDSVLLLKESYPVDTTTKLRNEAISFYTRELNQVRLLLGDSL